MTVHMVFDMIDNFGDWHGDVWGTALGSQFSIAEALYQANAEIPEEWEFEPSPFRMGLPEDDLLAQEIYSQVNAGRFTWDDVRAAGCALSAMVEHYRATGKSY